MAEPSDMRTGAGANVLMVRSLMMLVWLLMILFCPRSCRGGEVYSAGCHGFSCFLHRWGVVEDDLLRPGLPSRVCLWAVL